MGFIDDLDKATNMFVEGTQRLAINAGVNNAQKQIADINASQLDEIEKRKQASAVAQNLALDLTKAGAPASAIQQAFGAIAPPQVQNANDANLQGLMTGSQQLQDVAKKQQFFEEQPKLNLAKEQNSGKKEVALLKESQKLAMDNMKQERALDKEDRTAIRKVQGQFNTQTQKSFEAIQNMSDLSNLLDKNNGIADAAVRSRFAKLLSPGAVSDYEQQQVAGSPDLKSRLERFIAQANEGTRFTENDRQIFKQTIQELKSGSQTLIHQSADKLAAQVTPTLNGNYDPTEFKNKFLLPGASAPASAPAPSQAAPQDPMAGATPITVRGPDGNVIQALKLPDGRIVRKK